MDDAAEALLAGTFAALQGGDLKMAERWAAEAQVLFEQQGRAVWAANASQTGIQARYLSGGATPDMARDACTLPQSSKLRCTGSLH